MPTLRRALRAAALSTVAAGCAAALAQSNVKPPQAQAWIDVATFSGFGMPGGGMGGMGGAGGPMGALGALFGGGGQKNSFGHTQSGSAGRWVDVTLASRLQPALAEAEQQVPAGFLASPLKLQAPKAAKPPPRDDEDVVDEPVERPKGRLLLYWGCGATVRAGQPKVLDMASASAADLGKFFVSRRATQRGAHSAPGRPLWPSPDDARMVPAQATLAGEHAFTGAGVPEGFRFRMPEAQELMPALEVAQQDDGGATRLSWTAPPSARGHFVAGMGAAKADEMVIWTSSEVPETGFGLVDYQTNAAVERWVKEKVLLAPATTQCTVPKGVFPSEGAMLRVVAYGPELNLAHPPRPADPKAPWEPVWAVKVRVKSVAGLMLGMPSMPSMSAPNAPAGEEPADKPADKRIRPLDALKGILGR